MDLLHERQGGDHVIWHEAGIKLVFSRLHESHEDLSSLLRISIESFHGRTDGDLFDGKVILTGPRSKADVVKHCQTRIGEFLDWGALIEKACIIVRAKNEEGNPLVDLSEGEVPPEAPWLIAPLFKANEHSLVFGAGGTGKSTMVLACAAMLASGQSLWGLQANDEPQTVVYVDYEDDEENFKRRLWQLADGLGVPRPRILYKKAEASLPLMAESLARQMAQVRATGLFVDSAALACGTDPQTAEAANAYFRALRTIPVRWSITIAHQPKDKENSKYPYGSIFWWNNPRRVIHATGMKDHAHNGVRVALEVVKANHGEIGIREGFIIAYTNGHIEIERAQALSGMIDMNKIEIALTAIREAGGPIRAIEWVELSGLDRGTIDAYAPRLVAQNKVAKLARGLYEYVKGQDEDSESRIPDAYQRAFDDEVDPF